MTKEKRITIAIFILIGIFVLVGRLHSGYFKRNHNLSIGYVTKTDAGGKGNFGPRIYYKYCVYGKWQYDSRRASEIQYSKASLLIGKSFPVAYKKQWFGYAAAILQTPRDFDLYHYPFPDSLNWILQYIDQ